MITTMNDYEDDCSRQLLSKTQIFIRDQQDKFGWKWASDKLSLQYKHKTSPRKNSKQVTDIHQISLFCKNILLNSKNKMKRLNS